MPADKPRHLQNSHDLILSIVPLVLICLALAGLAKGCSFSPGGPSSAPPPTVDAVQSLSDAARNEPFPLRLPTFPAGWVANSSDDVSVGGSDGGASVRVGFITPRGSYLRLAQSNVATDLLLAEEVPGVSTASGATMVGGRTWDEYSQPGKESAWVTDLGAVRLLVTGSGTPAEFAELAAAVLDARPLPAT